MPQHSNSHNLSRREQQSSRGSMYNHSRMQVALPNNQSQEQARASISGRELQMQVALPGQHEVGPRRSESSRQQSVRADEPHRISHTRAALPTIPEAQGSNYDQSNRTNQSVRQQYPPRSVRQPEAPRTERQSSPPSSYRGPGGGEVQHTRVSVMPQSQSQVSRPRTGRTQIVRPGEKKLDDMRGER